MTAPCTSSPKPRLDHLDALKAIGMFLVFYGHLTDGLRGAEVEGARQVSRWIYSFHMPLFFLVSGLFFRSVAGSAGKWLLTKVRTRLLPVLVFGLICLPLFLIRSDGSAGLQSVLVGYSWGLPYLNWTTWFLICLFWVELMAAGISALETRLSKPVARWGLLLLILASGILAISMGSPWAEMPPNAWFVREAVIALPFYFFGHLIRPWATLPGRQPHDLRILIACILVFIVAEISEKAGSTGVNMAGGTHGDPYRFYAAATAGSCALLILCRLGSRGDRISRFVGPNALLYLGFAGVSLAYLDRALIGWWLPRVPEWLALPAAALQAVAMMAFFAPTVWAIRRWVPGWFGMTPMPSKAGSTPPVRRGSL